MLPLLGMTLVSSLPQVKQVYDGGLCCEFQSDTVAGATMEPVSWQEMRCPRTGRIEKRKCAKPEGL